MRSTLHPTTRVFMLTALFFTGYSGVVMASSTACQVAVLGQLHAVQGAVHRRMHHSAATLARWKVGAAAWSKAHGGRTYTGLPTARKQDWTPLRFTCEDVALDLSRPDLNLLLPVEELPELAMRSEHNSDGIGLDLAAKPRPAEDTLQQAMMEPLVPVPFGGTQPLAGGGAPDGPVGPASFPPGAVPPTLAGPVPAPESPTIVLLGTGMLSFLVSRLRRKTIV